MGGRSTHPEPCWSWRTSQRRSCIPPRRTTAPGSSVLGHAECNSRLMAAFGNCRHERSWLCPTNEPLSCQIASVTTYPNTPRGSTRRRSIAPGTTSTTTSLAPIGSPGVRSSARTTRTTTAGGSRARAATTRDARGSLDRDLVGAAVDFDLVSINGIGEVRALERHLAAHHLVDLVIEGELEETARRNQACWYARGPENPVLLYPLAENMIDRRCWGDEDVLRRSAWAPAGGPRPRACRARGRRPRRRRNGHARPLAPATPRDRRRGPRAQTGAPTPGRVGAPCRAGRPGAGHAGRDVAGALRRVGSRNRHPPEPGDDVPAAPPAGPPAQKSTSSPPSVMRPPGPRGARRPRT